MAGASAAIRDGIRARFGDDDLRFARMSALIRGAAGGLSNRALSMLVALISVPLTIGYLGVEEYGIWVTIGSVLTWMVLTDFGLGTGLTNAVTRDVHRDRPDLVRTHLSNFLAATSGILAVLLVVLALVWTRIDWASLFGVRSPVVAVELRQALVVAIAIFALKMPLGMSAKVYIAYQEGHIGNRWAAAGSVLSLVATLAVIRLHGGIVWLVGAVYGSALVLELVNTSWLFLRHRPGIRPSLASISWKELPEISNVGGKFFLITIMALVTFQTDTLMIAHFRGSGSVPQYSVPYQLFSYAVLPQTIAFPYIWSSFTEALTRGDIAWVRRAFRNYVLLSVLSALAIACVLLAIGGPFIGWWTHGKILPPFALLLLLGCWAVINAYSGAVSCLLAAASRLTYQLVYSGLATVSNLVLSIYLVQRLGVIGVLIATVGSYAILVCGPTWLDVQQLLRERSR